jgi:acyl-CoA synthetase (AMP-forming)/AMP-acid ligase II
MNIAAVLRERALDSADTPAIIEGNRTVTFADLEGIADGVARQLHRAGVGAADRVLVFCPMSIALYATLVGLWRVGGVAMFLDPSAGRDHIERCCRLAAPAALVATPHAHGLRLVSRALRRVPIALSIGRWVPGATPLRIAPRHDADHAIASADADSPALITFTSGSTGQPKAAVRSHGFLLAQHRVLADDLDLRRGQRDLAALPIFVLANLASAVTSVVPDADLRRPGDIDASRLLRQIRRVRPTRVAASPALLERLARHTASRRELLSEFESIYTGGAPVFPRLLQSLQAVAPSARVVAVYGSTEAEPIAKVAWSEIAADDLQAMESGAGLLVGRPVAAIQLRILPDRWGAPIGPFAEADFAGSLSGRDRRGEIVVAGAHVLPGYLDGAGDEETKFRVGNTVWHRTGDAGYLDAQQRLWLLGRCSARLEDQHGVLYPFAAECAALVVDGVRRCALVQHGGARVLAVELDGVSREEARRALLTRLAWARLQEVIAVDQLPMDKRHNAKIDYPALRRMLAARYFSTSS